MGEQFSFRTVMLHYERRVHTRSVRDRSNGRFLEPALREFFSGRIEDAFGGVCTAGDARNLVHPPIVAPGKRSFSEIEIWCYCFCYTSV